MEINKWIDVNQVTISSCIDYLSSNKRLWIGIKSHTICHMYWIVKITIRCNNINTLVPVCETEPKLFVKTVTPLPSISPFSLFSKYCYRTTWDNMFLFNSTPWFTNDYAAPHFPVHTSTNMMVGPDLDESYSNLWHKRTFLWSCFILQEVYPNNSINHWH